MENPLRLARKSSGWVLVAALLASSLVACGGAPTPTPIPRATPTPTPIVEAAPTPTPTVAPIATPTPAGFVIPANIHPYTRKEYDQGRFPYGNQWGRKGWDKAPDIQRLYEAAKKEGLVLALSHAELKRQCAEFVKLFPGVRCEERGAGAEAVSTVYVSERRSGVHATDVVATTLTVASEVLKRNFVAQDTDFTKYGVEKTRTALNGRLVYYSQNMYNHLYNANFVKKEELPKTLEDFLDPKWKGKIAASTFQYHAAMGYASTFLGLDWALALGRKLEQEQQMVIVPSAVTLLVSGEKWLSFQAGDFANSQRLRDKQPVDYFFTDYMNVFNFVSMVVDDAPHPNAGTLFGLFVASENTSEILYNTPPGCPCASGWPGYGHGVKEVVDGTYGGVLAFSQTPETYEALANGAAAFRKAIRGQ